MIFPLTNVFDPVLKWQTEQNDLSEALPSEIGSLAALQYAYFGKHWHYLGQIVE